MILKWGGWTPQQVADCAVKRAIVYSLKSKTPRKRAATWSLFIDALMEAPEVTDDG